MRVLNAWTISIGLMLLLWGAPSTAEEHTLEDLYRVGMQKSEKIRISSENVEIADTGKYKALSSLLPKATAFGAYTNYTENKVGTSGALLRRLYIGALKLHTLADVYLSNACRCKPVSNATPDSTFRPSLPDTDMHFLTTGFGYVIGYNYHGGHTNTPWPAITGSSAQWIAPQRLTGAIEQPRPAPHAEREAAPGAEREADVGPGQGQPEDRLGDVARLGRGRAHELAAGGGVEEEVADRHRGPPRPRHRADLAEHAPLDLHPRAGPVLPRRRVELEARDRGDGRDRLPPEPHGADGGEPLDVAQLRGGVALQRQQRVLALHAAAVVGHPDEGEPALLHVHGDGGRARVEGVLDQLLHDGGRALDHLARGDLVDEPGREDLDARHGAVGSTEIRRARPPRTV